MERSWGRAPWAPRVLAARNRIGGNAWYPGDFNGLIDNVRLYDRALNSGGASGGHDHRGQQHDSSVRIHACADERLGWRGRVAVGRSPLTTGAGCTWTASSSASWITGSPTSGIGAGSVGYTVAANTSTSSRTGTMAIGGQTFIVTQAGVCNYTLAPTSASVAGTGVSGTVTLTTGAGCTWTASSSASWITVSPDERNGHRQRGLRRGCEHIDQHPHRNRWRLAARRSP